MTRPFWTRPDRSEFPTCETLDSLLSPYVDGVASSDEARRVESHLPSCAICRQSLLWMQETRRVLAGRPVVLPPPDLYARIARSIASEAAPPAVLPARVFTLRPAYAAAASLSLVAALVSYGLLHTQPRAHVAPTPPAEVATAPKTTLPMPVKRVVPKANVKIASPRALVALAQTRHQPEKMAAVVPRDEQGTIASDATPTAPPIHADVRSSKPEPVVTPPIRVHPRVLPHVKPTSPRAPSVLEASSKLPRKPVEDRVPKTDSLVKKHTDPLVASDKVPEARVPIQVEPPVVTNDTPPVVRTASASSDPLGAVHAYLHVHQTSFERNLSLAGSHAVNTAVRNTAFSTGLNTEGGVNIVSGPLTK